MNALALILCFKALYLFLSLLWISINIILLSLLSFSTITFVISANLLSLMYSKSQLFQTYCDIIIYTRPFQGIIGRKELQEWKIDIGCQKTVKSKESHFFIWRFFYYVSFHFPVSNMNPSRSISLFPTISCLMHLLVETNLPNS